MVAAPSIHSLSLFNPGLWISLTGRKYRPNYRVQSTIHNTQLRGCIASKLSNKCSKIGHLADHPGSNVDLEHDEPGFISNEDETKLPIHRQLREDPDHPKHNPKKLNPNPNSMAISVRTP